MSEDRCIICNKVISDGKMMCSLCEDACTRIGMILQSRDATKDEIKKTYNFIKKGEKK